jgi:hypothetical protein
LTVFSPKWWGCCGPGGHFLYADFRGFLEYDAWDAALADMPMRMVSKRVINTEVLRGMDNNSPRYLGLVARHLPKFLQSFGRLFAGAPGALMLPRTATRQAFVPDVPLHQRLRRSNTSAGLRGSLDPASGPATP